MPDAGVDRHEFDIAAEGLELGDRAFNGGDRDELVVAAVPHVDRQIEMSAVRNITRTVPSCR